MYFPKGFHKRQLPVGIFQNDNIQNLQFPMQKLPKSALATVLGPLPCSSRNARLLLAHPSRNVWTHYSLWRLRSPIQTFGKLQFVILQTWEVATREIVTWEVALKKKPLGNYLIPF